MAYINPNTTIRIYSGIPFDNTYQHTVYFSTEDEQKAYFHSPTRAKFSFINNTYQRVTKGTMRIERNAEDLEDCNYLAFQNGAYGNKWFYCFITNVEYVNNITAEVTFEVDVMQTYLFDIGLLPSFVEREHSESDNIGDNLVPENLELGDYVSEGVEQFLGEDLPSENNNIVAPTSIVIASTVDRDYEKVSGGYYSRVFSGLNFIDFPNTTQGASDCEAWLRGLSGIEQDAVVSIFIMPTNFITTLTGGPKSYPSSITKLSHSMFSDYQIRNNKLFTYPYNFLYVTNLQGTYASYRYEYFSDLTCNFLLAGDMTCDPTVLCVPTNYKGVAQNYDEKLTLGGYPQCGWNTDSFKAWLAQNAGNFLSGTLGTSYIDSARAWGMSTPSVVTQTAGVAASVGSPFALAMAGIHVANSVAKMTMASMMPPQAHGSNGKATMVSMGIQTFAVYKKHIREEFARIIDDYFDMYGYATHRVKVPNRNVRQHWTYVKTIGCHVNGKAPSSVINQICGIYDNGITFWRNANEVGDYSLFNGTL